MHNAPAFPFSARSQHLRLLSFQSKVDSAMPCGLLSAGSKTHAELRGYERGITYWVGLSPESDIKGSVRYRSWKSLKRVQWRLLKSKQTANNLY
jgi:hypothetical protein